MAPRAPRSRPVADGRHRPDLAALVARPARARGVFADHGLTGADFDVLATLRRAGAPYHLTPGELSRSTMVTTGGMTKRLDRLEATGLIQREPDPRDRRGKLIVLTPKGSDLVDHAVEAHLENEERLLAALPRRNGASWRAPSRLLPRSSHGRSLPAAAPRARSVEPRSVTARLRRDNGQSTVARQDAPVHLDVSDGLVALALLVAVAALLVVAPALRVPYPILLVLGGLVLGLVPGMPEFELQPELVLLRRASAAPLQRGLLHLAPRSAGERPPDRRAGDRPRAWRRRSVSRSSPTQFVDGLSWGSASCSARSSRRRTRSPRRRSRAGSASRASS